MAFYERKENPMNGNQNSISFGIRDSKGNAVQLTSVEAEDLLIWLTNQKQEIHQIVHSETDQEEKITFQQFVEMVRAMGPWNEEKGGLAYNAELLLKANVNIWIDTNENGEIDMFTPHINFYEQEDDDERLTQTMATIHPTNGDEQEIKTPQQAAQFLTEWAKESGIDTNAPLWFIDEGY
jgi:hypothetical protein